MKSIAIDELALQKEILYFRKVFEFGNLSLAALSLKTTQPSLSKAIKQLEQDLGVTLFSRGRFGVRPTAEGHAFYAQLEPVWSALKHFRWESPRPKLSLGFHPSIAIDFLPASLVDLFNKDSLQLSFRLQNSRSSVMDVIHRELDAAVVANPVRHKELVVRALSQEGVGLFGNHRTLARKKVLVHPDQIGLVRCLKAIGPRPIVELRDYELIAAFVSKFGDSFQGLLPDHVARRYGLQRMSKTLHRVEICLVYRADYPYKDFLRTQLKVK